VKDTRSRTALQAEIFARDDCGLCGKQFKHFEICLIGWTTDGTFVRVGECCSGKLKSAIGGSIYFSALALAKSRGRA